MALLKTSRPSSSQSLSRKPQKPRKKTRARREWDSTMSDLSVHRATPEELVHRHEIHKSKNQWLAHWELQNNVQMSKNKKDTFGPLERKRLDIMKEILLDQYEMKDVLERSDRAMAVVKDLFGDAPRRHTGFPNVTMAPSDDQETFLAPIVQRKDHPTRLSLLSGSIMDSQALNEIEKSFTPSEHSEEEPEVSCSFQPKGHPERTPQGLKDEYPQLVSQMWGKTKPKSLRNTFVTPCKTSENQTNSQAALNATTAVRRIVSRLQAEQPEEQAGSHGKLGHVLNPTPKNQQKHRSKGKKICDPSAQTIATNERSPPRVSAESTSCSLILIYQMIHDVEKELEEYERQTGREVISPAHAQGLTGFSLSLVSSLRRLVVYLKETYLQLRVEANERQRMKEELYEQRALIDALTAELLALKDASQGAQPRLQESEGQEARSEMSQPEYVNLLCTPDTAHALTPQSCTSGQCLQLQDKEDDSMKCSSDPLHMFTPAVMLSPPRQKTHIEYANQSALCKKTISTVRSSTENISTKRVEHYPDDKLVESPSTPDTYLLAQRGMNPKYLNSSDTSTPCIGVPQSYILSQGYAHMNQNLFEPLNEKVPAHEIAMEESSVAHLRNADLATRMAELTLQNNAFKAQLKKLCSNDQVSDALKTRSPSQASESSDNASSPGMCNKIQLKSVGPVESNLELRIAELNRQSAEARNRLLYLIEQQKQSEVISPALSPISLKYEGAGDKAVEMAMSMYNLPDSPVNGSKTPVNRSAIYGRSLTRPGSSVGGKKSACGQWPKDDQDSGGKGWFALSAHVS